MRAHQQEAVMDAATLIERINRDIQEQEPTFEALREALSSCDPHLQFAVREGQLPDVPEPTPERSALTWAFAQRAALHRTV
jgi:hypothetical protein